METKRRQLRSNGSIRLGFTLVELLVVITIIGILASLITVAAVGALNRAQQARTKIEVDQVSTAFQDYKQTFNSYPPNCQVDDQTADPTGDEPAATPLSEYQAFADLKRHLRQAFPKHREDDNLLRMLVGLNATAPNASNYPNPLPGGMTAGEALVFWLGGFSGDDRYPISGEGGPSYRIDNLESDVDPNEADPIEGRRWRFPFEITRLKPRGLDGFFDKDSTRFIEYSVAVNGQPQDRRINFWQYVPVKSEQPYLYFDTSRHPAAELNSSDDLVAPYDPPAATELTQLGPNGDGLHVHAIKVRSESAGATTPIEFANKDNFQILHCGIDGDWGAEAFEQMSAHAVGTDNPSDYLLFPEGPFTGAVADTIVNFSEGTLEKSTP